MKAMEIENDPRLARILTTRGLLFGLQGAAIALFAFYVVVLNGLSLRPVYFPIYNAVFLGSILLLIVSIERIFFFRLCIVYGKRSGAKFLIARKRFRGSVALIAVAAVLAAVLIVFTFTPVLNMSGNVHGQLGTVEFQSSNLLALNSVSSITITNTGAGNLTFAIVPAGDYNAAGATNQEANESALMQASINPGTNHVTPGNSVTVDIFPTLNSRYFVVMFPSGGTVSASYTLGMKAMPSLMYALFMAAAAVPVSGYMAAYSRSKMKELRPATIFA